MERNEQVGARRLPDGDALAERQEPVVIARQADIVFPARGEAERQGRREFEHDCLFVNAAPADRSRIDAAMAGVDHDRRPLQAGRQPGQGRGRALPPGAQAPETRACGASPAERRQIEHEPVPPALRGRPDAGRRDSHRRVQVQHHTPHAFVEHARPQPGNRARAACRPFGGPCRQGQIDNRPVRVGEREGAEGRLRGQVEHEPGAFAARGQAHVLDLEGRDLARIEGQKQDRQD